MVVGVNCGHTASGAGYGAVGIIKESEHTRLVGQALMDLLRAAGVTVIDCTIDQAATQNEYLAKAVALANNQDLDLFISIHFNASAAHTGHGVEAFTYGGTQHEEALKICKNISGLGFTNRGVKDGSSLYVIKHTKAKAMLIEVCFCDNEEDVNQYQNVGYSGIAKAICNAILPYAEEKNSETAANDPSALNVLYRVRKNWADASSQIGAFAILDNAKAACTAGYTVYDENGTAVYGAESEEQTEPDSTDSPIENHNITQTEFIEFVGAIAQRDWQERKIMLPSVVIAQAIKESAWGKSELAQNANALFGIKQNGWTGEVYYKDATEQNPDGTYRKDESVAWRKYGSWEESIIDHNTYIATRMIGSQSAPNWKNVIGCDNYILAVQYLQDAQFAYATSQTYAESLINDYIEKYNLTKYDEVSPVQPDNAVADEAAPEGMLYVVQAGAYKNYSNAKALQDKLESMGVVSLVKRYRVEEAPD